MQLRSQSEMWVDSIWGVPSLVLSLPKRVILATPFGISFPDVFLIL